MCAKDLKNELCAFPFLPFCRVRNVREPCPLAFAANRDRGYRRAWNVIGIRDNDNLQTGAVTSQILPVVRFVGSFHREKPDIATRGSAPRLPTKRENFRLHDPTCIRWGEHPNKQKLRCTMATR